MRARVPSDSVPIASPRRLADSAPWAPTASGRSDPRPGTAAGLRSLTPYETSPRLVCAKRCPWGSASHGPPNFAAGGQKEKRPPRVLVTCFFRKAAFATRASRLEILRPRHREQLGDGRRQRPNAASVQFVGHVQRSAPEGFLLSHGASQRTRSRLGSRPDEKANAEGH